MVFIAFRRVFRAALFADFPAKSMISPDDPIVKQIKRLPAAVLRRLPGKMDGYFIAGEGAPATLNMLRGI